MIIARKIFFPNFGGTCPPCPLLLRLGFIVLISAKYCSVDYATAMSLSGITLVYGMTYTINTSRHQWRRNEINNSGARRGPNSRNSKPEVLSQTLGFLERGLTASPRQLGVCGSAVSFPSGVRGESRPPRFFWCILGSSGELSCNPAMQNCVCRPLYYRCTV